MTVFVRAVVMLVTLVGLPAAWIYYGPLPPGPQKVVDRFVEVARDALGWKRNPTRQTADPQGVAPRFGSQEAFPEVPTFLDAAVTPTPLPSVREDEAEVPTLEAAASSGTANPAPVTLASAHVAPAQNSLHPLLRTQPTSDLQEELRPHLTLLRSLGAADYKLEKWGSAGREYRFCCSVALGADAALARNFQAINSDPLAAVRDVVGEVTAWQNARLAPAESVTRLR